MVQKGTDAKDCVKWQDVLRAVQRTEVRVALLARFRGRGFDADSFRIKTSRRAMVEAMTSTEDWLEREHPRWFDDRAQLKAVRRRLELELWP